MLPPVNEVVTSSCNNVVVSRTLRSPNNNNNVGGVRNSVCLSETVVPVLVGPKRRSWCGVPFNNSRRYAEVGQWKLRNDAAFLEPYMQGLDGGGSTLPSGDLLSPDVPLQPLPVTNLGPFGLGRLRGSAGDSLDQSHDSISSEGGVHDDIVRRRSSGPGGPRSGDGSDGDSEGGGVSESSADTGYGAACDISLVERLVRTHPVWFLPGIQRAGAFHLLQGKEEGNFVVRQSSQPDTMALSVRLPADKGPYIEHYLIQSAMGRLGLETSENRFNDIPSLIAYYSQCCDELPVQLTLPRAIKEAKTRQQLSSLALLGQEFWRYPMANPRPPDRTTPTQQISNELLGQNPETGSVTLNLNPIMSTFKGSTTVTESLTSVVSRSQRPTPPNTLNIISNMALLTRPAITSASSASSTPEGCVKSPPPPPPRWAKPPGARSDSSAASSNFTVTTTVTFSVNSQTADERDVVSSPSHVEVSCVREDPSKRLSPEGQCVSTISSHGSIRRASCITKTSTSSNNSTSQIVSPTSDTISASSQQQITHVLSPTNSVLSPTDSVISPTQTGSGPPSLLSPLTPDAVSPLPLTRTSGRHSKRSKSGRKFSKHYQESDILDSPTVYYRSSVGDKASDYEDIWGPDHSVCSTFKPSRINQFASPDLIQHTGNIISLNNNILSPANSQPESGNSGSQSSSPHDNNPTTCEAKNRLNLSLPTNMDSPVCKESPLSPCLEESDIPKPKQGSPFYAEPADSLAQIAVIKRHTRPSPLALTQRHSNPSSFYNKFDVHTLQDDNRLDQNEILASPISSSVDNLNNINSARILKNNKLNGKPIQPPMVRSFQKNDTSWTLDNSWQFIGNESDESCVEDSDWGNPFPPLTLVSPHTPESPRDKVTVQQVIARKFPELNLVQSSKYPVDGMNCRMSSYDNVEGKQPPAPPSEISEPGTVFSEPWTETSWSPSQNNNSKRISVFHSEDEHDEDTRMDNVEKIKPTKLRERSFRDKLDPLLSPPRVMALRSRESGAAGAGIAIRNYALQLAQDKSTTFAQNIENFISCTRESRETNPQIVMRNMRQFMSGMKNYLVKHGERGFEREVEKERSKLKETEFLNLDAILEGVLHRLVVRPLRSHLQTLFVDYYTKTGAIKLLADNIQYANTRPMSELAVGPKITPPSETDLETIRHFLQRLQDADSPLDKLENLLAAIATIFHSVKYTHTSRSSLTLGADDFLPVFVWVLVKTNFVAAEIEAEYMWGLLHPSLLSGEGGYYLTTLSSAVHVLKNFKSSTDDDAHKNSDVNSDFPPVLKVVVPDERHGSILTKTVPIRPHMTTKQICKIIAHKSRITNPQDYALYRLIDGEETMLLDGECPQEITGNRRGMLVYKRIDAKIAWPKQRDT